MAYAFNFSQLTSLKLERCVHAGMFISGVLESGHVISLTSLEITVEHEDNESEYDIGWILAFLAATKGLEELYLGLLGRIDELSLWTTLLPTDRP
jgi:hypothetical protein